jgi:hypothetical protein
MSDEADGKDRFGNHEGGPPKILWLAVALSPLVLIAMLIAGGSGRGGGGTASVVICYFVNPVVSVVGCYRMLGGPGRDKATHIFLGVLLGLMIAPVNFFLGAFAGCACSGVSIP